MVDEDKETDKKSRDDDDDELDSYEVKNDPVLGDYENELDKPGHIPGEYQEDIDVL